MKTALLLAVALITCCMVPSCTAVAGPYGYSIMVGGKGAMKTEMEGEPVYPNKKEVLP